MFKKIKPFISLLTAFTVFVVQCNYIYFIELFLLFCYNTETTILYQSPNTKIVHLML